MGNSAKLWVVVVTVSCLATAFLAAPAHAGAGKATQIVNVADTRNMQEGPSKWIADLYNTNLWLYASAVVIVMMLMGVILGFGFDFIAERIGLDLGRMDHRE